MKILLIDDSRVIHAYVAELLADAGHALTHALDGENGLAVFPSLQPDLVLLDWEMPGIQGIEVLERLRGEGARCPILMMTTKNKPADIARAIALGASEYLMKPFTKEVLLDKLRLAGVG